MNPDKSYTALHRLFCVRHRWQGTLFIFIFLFSCRYCRSLGDLHMLLFSLISSTLSSLPGGKPATDALPRIHMSIGKSASLPSR